MGKLSNLGEGYRLALRHHALEIECPLTSISARNLTAADPPVASSEPDTKRQIFTTGFLRRDLEALHFRYPSNIEPSIPADLPGNPAIGDEPDDLAAKAARDQRPPGDEGEFLGVPDQGVAAGGELDRLAVGGRR